MDSKILQAFDQGDMELCFKLLIQEYKEKLYWHIRKIVVNHDDADDAVQTTFIKIWKNLKGFQRESKLSSWVYRIATNEALQLLRKRKPNVPIDELIIESQDNSSSYFTHEEGNALEEKLQEAVLALPNKQRMVFNMKYFDDMKYNEISEILGTSVGGLKASYHLAVKKIEEILNPN